MIVYNLNRAWFTEKVEAEAARRLAGLKPGATCKVTVSSREDLAALLNALCEPPAFGPKGVDHAIEPILERAYVPTEVDVPDYIPRFLLDAEGQKRWDERHRVAWDEQREMLK